MSERRDIQHGRAWLWLLVGLALALGVAMVMLFKLMDGSPQEVDGGEPGPTGPGAQEDPHPPTVAQPERPATVVQPGAHGMHRSAARHRDYLKNVKKAPTEPWELDAGGPKEPVTVAVARSKEELHPEIAAASNKLRPKIAACYQRRLLAKPNLGGKIFVSFSLTLNNNNRSVVDKSRIAVSRLKDVPLETCVLRALTTLEIKPLTTDAKWHHVTFAMAPGANRELFPRQQPEPEPSPTRPGHEPEPDPRRPPGHPEPEPRAEPEPERPPGPEPEHRPE